MCSDFRARVASEARIRLRVRVRVRVQLGDRLVFRLSSIFTIVI